jgi:ATP-dependent Clp protease ATP-binding subunit ClpB
VGHEEGGQLTEAVRRRGYCVVLLDEIEKAHADVFNILLQVLDDGRLTDGQGRTVDFRNTLIIMTSNLGTSQETSSTRETVISAVHKHFRPEFVNRIDEMVVFDALGSEQLREIITVLLGQLESRLTDLKVSIAWTDSALEWLIGKGHNQAFGARPLQRSIQRYVEDPLSMALVTGELAPHMHIQLALDKHDQMTFDYSPAQG